MDFRRLPPLVGSTEVTALNAALGSVQTGESFALMVSPVADSHDKEPSAEIIEQRLTFMLRIAAHASYVLGKRVVKIAGLGHDWSAFDDRTTAYFRTASTTNYLSVLANGGFSSLSRIEEWGRPAEAGTVSQSYADSLSNIERALTFFRALGIPIAQEVEELDLWYSYASRLGRVEDELLARSDPVSGARRLLTGHLIEVLPSLSVTDAGLVRSVALLGNPLTVNVVDEESAELAVGLLQAREFGAGRFVVVRIGTSELLDLVGSALRSTNNSVIVVEVDLGTPASVDERVDRARELFRRTGELRRRVSGLSFVVQPGSHGTSELVTAVAMIDLMATTRFAEF